MTPTATHERKHVMKCENAPQGGVSEILAGQRTNQMEITTTLLQDETIVEAIAELITRLEDLEAHVGCRACCEPPPPLPRWPGDPHARDHRGPHRCSRGAWQ